MRSQCDKAIDSAYKKYGKKTSLAAQKKYHALIAKAADEFNDGLKAIAFPPEIQGDATALIKATVVFQRHALAAAAGEDLGSPQ